MSWKGYITTEIQQIVNDQQVSQQLYQIDRESTLSQEEKTDRKTQLIENEIDKRIQEWKKQENISFSQLLIITEATLNPDRLKELIQNVVDTPNF